MGLAIGWISGMTLDAYVEPWGHAPVIARLVVGGLIGFATAALIWREA